MKTLLTVALLLGGGCFEDRYRCTSSTQCNLGEGGRCETDGFCTNLDDDCDSGRRYQHAGDHGNACFEDAVVLKNACAGGQAPAKKEGCFVAVCDRVPACCSTAWTDACVQLAQELCVDLQCDTRIAITASRGTLTELWDLRWNGNWQFTKRTEYASPLQWVAPAPDETQPRLAATTGNNAIIVGELRFPTPPNRVISSITSINLDRDRRDTLVFGSSGPGGDRLDVLKADDGASRSSSVLSAAGIVWGDLDRNTQPDAVARPGNQYHFLPSRDGAGHIREVRTDTMVNPQGGQTDTAPLVRSVDWIDIDGDKHLDLVAFGADLRIHTDPITIRETPEIRADCDPPSSPIACNGDPDPNVEALSFGGTTRPTKAANELVLTGYPGRKLYRATFTGSTMHLDQVKFPGDTCQCIESCESPCGNPCQCTYNCNACVPIVAVVARDLDGDHQLDIIAIDARLNLFHSLAITSFSVWVGPTSIPTQLTNPEGFISISTSVSGARL